MPGETNAGRMKNDRKPCKLKLDERDRICQQTKDDTRRLRGRIAEAESSAPEDSHAEQRRLQILWDAHMQKMPLPRRHQRTSVLLLSWAPECDDLGTQDEVRVRSAPLARHP
jgi:hypothetical protein